jgi:MATE family multidrug resistance protein
VIAFLLHIFAPLLTTLMGATDTTHSFALTYIQIRAFGMPAVLIMMTSTGILYGLGDMRTPLYIAVGVNVLNICLDALLIFGFGPVPPMGIAGAAIASSVSQYLGAIACGVTVWRAIGFTFDIELSNISRFTKIGRDMLLRTGSMIIFLLLATRLATGLGAEAGAINQAIRQAWVFTAFFLDATAVVAQSIIGYYYGSAKKEHARQVAKLVCGWSGALGLLLMVSMLFGADLGARVLAPTVSYYLFLPVWIIAALFQPIAAIAFVTDGIHWGTGDFRYLRNVVVFATSLGAISLIFLEYFSIGSLNLIWWITGGWICIRALFGILRIWPGTPRSPLYLQYSE